MGKMLSDVIDDLGMGCCQVRIILIAGSLVYGTGGCIITLLGLLPGAVTEELGSTNPYEKAALGSIVVLGMFIGNAFCFTVDSLGRRSVMILSASGMFVSIMLSSKSSMFPMILTTWLIIGISYGFAGPTMNAFIAETSPTKYRMIISSLCFGLFDVGSIVGVCIVGWIAPSLNEINERWRVIVVWACLPTLLYIMLALFPGFVESPHFLIHKGRREHANEQLAAMRSQNRRPEISIVFENSLPSAQSASVYEQLGIIFGPSHRATMITLGLTLFILNFMAHGLGYGLPQIVKVVDSPGSGVQTAVLVSIISMVGNYCAMVAERFLGRRGSLSACFVGCILSSGVFLRGVHMLSLDPFSDRGALVTKVGMYGFSFIQPLGWLAGYVYAGEAFPSTALATASGICMACGRIGGVAAPWAFQFSIEQTGSLYTYFVAQSFGCLFCVVLITLVLRETKGLTRNELDMIGSPTGNYGSNSQLDLKPSPGV